jgi:multiple sugar transport system substrate-binding protein
MSMIKTRCFINFSSIAVIISLAACSSNQTIESKKGVSAVKGEEKTDQAAPLQNRYNNEPVKLVLYDQAAALSPEEFEAFFIRPVQAKYPNITIEMTKTSGQELIAAGTVPDLITTSRPYVSTQLELRLGGDLTQMVKDNGIDLSRLQPEPLEALRQMGGNGELFGLPFSIGYGVTAYNKDIFDKFAVPYPKDEITWNQMLELGKKLTRIDQGVQYIGAAPRNAQAMTLQYSLPVIDLKTNKAVLTSDGYNKVFTLMKQFYAIPGYLGDGGQSVYEWAAFFKDQRVAMFPDWFSSLTSQLTSQQKNGGVPFNWDIVSFPVYDDRPTLGKQVDFHVVMVPPTGKNKDAASLVVKTMLSDEVQTLLNKSGRLTALKDDKVKSTLAQSLPLYKGKNVQGIFKVKAAPVVESTVYDTKIYKILKDSGEEMAKKDLDVNTVLRQANEKANQVINEAN